LGFNNVRSNNKGLKRNKKAFSNNNVVNTNNKGSRALREIEEEEELKKKRSRRIRGLEEGEEFKTSNLYETHFVQTLFLSLSSLPPTNVNMIFN